MTHKHIRMPVTLAALLLGVAAAFATNAQIHKNSKSADALYWFNSSADGTSVDQFAISDSPSETSPGSCTTGIEYCTKGFVESKTTVDPVTGHRELASGVTASDNDAATMRNP